MPKKKKPEPPTTAMVSCRVCYGSVIVPYVEQFVSHLCEECLRWRDGGLPSGAFEWMLKVIDGRIENHKYNDDHHSHREDY